MSTLTPSVLVKDNTETLSSSILKETELLGHECRIYGTMENPLFLAKDVADWIEYTGRTGQLLDQVDDDEKLMHKIYASGQNRDMWFLTENGVYEVLMLSRKPVAKEFKKAVKNILHEIRLTGSYTAVPKTFAEALRLAADQQEQIEKQEALLLEQQPKVEYYDNFMDSTSLFEIERLGKDTGIGSRLIFKVLEGDNVIRSKYVNGMKYYETYYAYDRYFKSVPSTFTMPDGTQVTRPKLMLTSEGLAYFSRKYIKQSA